MLNRTSSHMCYRWHVDYTPICCKCLHICLHGMLYRYASWFLITLLCLSKATKSPKTGSCGRLFPGLLYSVQLCPSIF